MRLIKLKNFPLQKSFFRNWQSLTDPRDSWPRTVAKGSRPCARKTKLMSLYWVRWNQSTAVSLYFESSERILQVAKWSFYTYELSRTCQYWLVTYCANPPAAATGNTTKQCKAKQQTAWHLLSGMNKCFGSQPDLTDYLKWKHPIDIENKTDKCLPAVDNCH